MEDLKTILSRLSKYLSDYDRLGKPNDARKIGECVCRVILLSSESETTQALSSKSKFQELIDAISKKNLDVNENHIKKIKLDLKVLQDFGNIDSHDNEVDINRSDSSRIRFSVESLLRNVFDSKEHIDIDQSLPMPIYHFISKDISESEDWKCTDIISIVYPNRYVTKASKSKDFEFYHLSDVNGKGVGFVFLGRNVSFSGAFKELFEEHRNDIEKLISISFLFPKEISKTTGLEVKNRKPSIISKCQPYQASHPNIEFSHHFIEDYIWDYCLINALKDGSHVTTEPFFVDQWLYKNEQETLSLDFIDSIISKTDDNAKPINVVVGDGGVGKTTFCLQVVEKIDRLLLKGQKKKALLLSSFDLPDEVGNNGERVDSIQSLYRILQDDPDLTLDSKNLALNISSGNLFIIIDGLDEIESKLKERFNLDLFIDSVVELNETYKNCSVLITSRENNSERFNRNQVDIFNLKGFNRELTEKYLDIRYNDDKEYSGKNFDNKVIKHIESLSLDSETNVTPLIIRLLCELVESEDKGSIPSTYDESKFFIMSEPLDKVLHQIIMRDILKQNISITSDDYFEILKDIVFDYKGMISKSDLDELLECSLHGKYTDNYTEFYVSPLLIRQGDHFKIKHDSFEFWLKSRFIANKINNQDLNLGQNVLTSISRDCYKGGALVEDIKFHRNHDDLVFLKNFIGKSIQELNSAKFEEKYKYRKILSSLAYLAMPKESGNKEIYTEKLLNLYGKHKGERINNLSIYGDFHPLDFRSFSVIDGYFNSYLNLSKSTFPSEDVVFVESEFIDVDIASFGKNDISADNFQDCILPDEFREFIKSTELSVTEKIDTIKNDLKKIFRVGFRQNSFVWKTEELYKQQCTSLKHKLNLSKYLEVLVQQGFLLKQPAKNSSGKGFVLNKEHENSVKDFITQSLINDSIENLLNVLQNK
ncbi:TPA: NACHT domain-containing protein [Vibrio vulnificus]|uniref:NACHT domain-containing protein n=1 Tax=Vibrio vulnificus TaxID=672 RepID=UPI0019D46914|nr:NACHT domain-containing protein [Vibrio vulnificus]MBN8082785.1 NACHT domain-containing protein [Vibrio vulnificus]MBN8125839.1 NACHT domain-containing protein [Vibrio vulnificus]MBN8130114.1 NACHT domain-containing protein [Vibrio vulnificus]MBN8135002.1 NACHT domain-containing protein [Vibrio vulnificus]MBN8158089.1 NACHT domain-containing protein [Vibrio vulnificus]